MRIGRVKPTPVKAPQRIERKVKKEQPIPVQIPKKKEQNVPTQT